MCCEIFVVIIVGYKKNRTKKEAVQALCRPRQTAKIPLPSVADGKGGTWRPPVLPGDGPFGQFAYHGRRQSQADGKDFAFAVRRADGKKERALTYS